jgi:hypothetical protein
MLDEKQYLCHGILEVIMYKRFLMSILVCATGVIITGQQEHRLMPINDFDHSIQLLTAGKRENMYIQKHVKDSDCNEIIKFVYIDQDEDLALGGLHVAAISHDEVEAILQKRKAFLRSERIKAYFERREQIKDRMQNGTASAQERAEFKQLEHVYHVIKDEASDSYSNHEAVSWQQFAKSMPHLAQELEKSDARLQKILATIPNPRVRLLQGNHELCMDYLESGSAKRFDPARIAIPVLTKPSDETARIFILKDAWSLFRENLKTTAEKALNRCSTEYDITVKRCKGSQSHWQSKLDKAQAALDAAEETRPSRHIEQLIAARRDARIQLSFRKKEEKRLAQTFQNIVDEYQGCLKELESTASPQ